MFIEYLLIYKLKKRKILDKILETLCNLEKVNFFVLTEQSFMRFVENVIVFLIFYFRRIDLN